MKRFVDEAAAANAAMRLKEIDSQIRKYHEGTRREPGFNQCLRELTFEEWREISEAIEQHSFPCMLGFHAYHPVIAVYAHGPIPGEQPDQLLLIESLQLPITAAKKGFAGQWELVNALAPLTHSPRNTEVLAWYGFPPLRELEHYVY